RPQPPRRRRPTAEARAAQVRSRTSDAARLVLDLDPGPGNGLQALLGDRLSGCFADAVGTEVELGQRVVDLLDRRSSLGRQRQVSFAFAAERVAFTAVLVE